MGIMDFIKGELIDVIEWTDDSRDTLSYRFPDEDKAIKNGAQLIVRESQVVQFMYLGQFGDTFGPGKHTLTTDNIPVLTKLQVVEVRLQLAVQGRRLLRQHAAVHRQQVGHVQPDHGARRRLRHRPAARLRHLRLQDRRPKLFLKEVAGSDQHFRLDEFADTMRSRIVSVFSDALASSHVPVLDVATRYTELGEALLPLINPAVGAKYGLEITSFILENVSVPPEVEAGHRQAVEHGGDRQPERLREVPDGQGHGGGRRRRRGGTAAELAVGFGIAQQMMQQGLARAAVKPQRPPAAAAAAAAPAAAPAADC